MLESFRIARYRFDLEAVEPLELPVYKGGTLRGGFGYAFKKMVCAQKDWRACTPCGRGNDCPYGYIFETSAPAGSEVLSNLQDVPIPFVIEPPLDRRRTYAAGDHLTFEVNLVGRASHYLPYFLLAFQELGRMGIGIVRGRFVLQRIVGVHPWNGAQELIYDGVEMHAGARDLSVSLAEAAGRAADFPADRLALKFLTPTRLKHADQFVERPDFHVLIRALLRRLSSLSYFHCGQLMEADFRGLISAAEAVTTERLAVTWLDWERYSTRQKKQMNLGGVVGEAEYRGQVSVFGPLLALGELTHVGKATVFGNGLYRVLER
jgi:hypothetical protein